MRIVSMLAGMLAGAAAATVITLGTGASASVQPVPMRPAVHHHQARPLPRWFRWGSTNDRVNGEPYLDVRLPWRREVVDGVERTVVEEGGAR